LSKAHLEETKEYLTAHRERPILVGDLNILHPDVVSVTLGPAGFVSSYDKEPYLSYPSKDEVLDYIVIPNERYTFTSVRCGHDGCSDHRALIAEIEENDRKNSA
jgi:hypothetical protein